MSHFTGASLTASQLRLVTLLGFFLHNSRKTKSVCNGAVIDLFYLILASIKVITWPILYLSQA